MTEVERNKILNEVMSQCEHCHKRMCCPEEECVLFRIEKIADGER